MKQFIAFALLLFATSIQTAYAQQWEKVYDGNDGTTIFVIGEDLFVPYMKGGLVLSSDNGKTWTHVDTTNDMTLTSNIVVTESGYIASTFGGVYRSTDKGRSWKLLSKWPTNSQWPNEPYYFNIAYVGGRLLAISNHARVISSKDDGKTWDSSNTGLPPTLYGYPSR